MSEIKNIIWEGPLDASGYSQCCQSYVEALSENGFNVKYVNSKVSTLLDGKGIDQKTRDKLLPLINNEITENYICVYHSVPDRFSINNNALLNIGYTVVETETIPEKWPYLCNKMDGIFTASKFCKNILIKNGVNVPIYVIPHCHDKSIITEDKYNISNLKKFNFLFMADMTPRKGWEELVVAYCKEFDMEEDVSMTFKVYFGDFSIESQKYCQDRIKKVAQNEGYEINVNTAPFYFYGGCLPNSCVMRFINTFDCIVSPHRSEGWALVLSQSMLLGKPTIASEYSGNLEFMNHDNSFLIPISHWEDICDEMVKINPNYRGLKWPVVGIKELRSTMRKVYSDRIVASQMGLEAQKSILNNFSYQEISKHIDLAIQDLIKIKRERNRN